jgi:hypothetical protein
LLEDAHRFAESLVGAERVAVDQTPGTAGTVVYADRDRMAS